MIGVEVKMNSKEELTILINAILGDKKSKKLISSQYGVIVKQLFNDLEVLDILKKKLYYDNKNHVIKMKEIKKSRFNFDYEDLKEWLENE